MKYLKIALIAATLTIASCKIIKREIARIPPGGSCGDYKVLCFAGEELSEEELLERTRRARAGECIMKEICWIH